jgi:hypothetical protein|tara:strand:+ start:1492 stop:1914 length:423 start_codon:yes stop_codon:yes gene_type:complete
MNRVEERFAYWWDKASRLVPKPSKITVEERTDAGDNGRHFAYCEYLSGDTIIAYSPDMVELPQRYIDGIILHEIGHAVDFSYTQPELEEMFGYKLDLEDEGRADEIAEMILGETVQYDLPKYVQCVGPACTGGRRPHNLL